ncbi:MAG: hypothetical protein AB7H93_23470 [Vicinamibacterales bacterium]
MMPALSLPAWLHPENTNALWLVAGTLALAVGCGLAEALARRLVPRHPLLRVVVALLVAGGALALGLVAAAWVAS